MNGISRHTNKFNLCTAHQIRHRIYHSIMLPVILCACICACAVSTTRYFVYSRAFGKRLVQRTRFNQVKKINWEKYLLPLIQAQFFPFKFDFHLFPCVLFFLRLFRYCGRRWRWQWWINCAKYIYIYTQRC